MQPKHQEFSAGGAAQDSPGRRPRSGRSPGLRCRQEKAPEGRHRKQRSSGLVLLSTVLAGMLWLGAGTALAHEGETHSARDLLFLWDLDPIAVGSIALSGWLYFRGLRRLWRQTTGLGITRWEATAFAGGWFTLVVALVSPLHPLGQLLFSAHMTQHELLILVAAPLLVLGRPMVPFLWALPMSWRRVLGRAGAAAPVAVSWRFVTNPLMAWFIHAVALWIWHAPGLFQAALNSDLVHTAQHISFLFTALLLWWALIHSRRGVKAYGAAVLYLFTTAMHNGALGALFTFGSRVWYPLYTRTTPSWGLEPLEDQQLGGLIMWIPMGVVYIIAGLALFAGWLRESERQASPWPADAELPEFKET